jgi:hypothetical protein
VPAWTDHRHLTEVRHRPGPAAAALVALIVVAGASIVVGGDQSPAPSAAVDQPAAPTPPAVPTLAELSGLDHDLVVAVTSPVGDPGRVLRWAVDAPAPVIDDTDLRSTTLDPSGTWVAGLRSIRGTDGGAVLWAGPVGGPLEPVDVAVSGFAWHDSRPAQLAWSRRRFGTSLVTVVELDRPHPHRSTLTIGLRQRLRSWGEWGFVLGEPGSTYRTTVLDRRGRVVVDAIDGYVTAPIPAVGLLNSRIEQPPAPIAVLDGAGDRQGALSAGRFGEFAWAVAPAPGGDASAVHLVRGPPRSRHDGGRVVVLDHDGRTSHILDDVGSWAAPRWSPDGTRLVFARQTSTAAAMITVYDRRDGTERSFSLPGLRPSRDWVSDLALVPATPGELAGAQDRP